MRRIAFGADGTGTMFERLVHACGTGEVPDAEIAVLFTNNAGAQVVVKAHQAGIPVLLLTGKKSERDRVLREALTKMYAPIDLVCLGGYLRLIPKEVVAAFPRRILNSHPAFDLVRFGGKGMWGVNVTKAIIATGLKETGSTVHFVDAQYDHGAIIAHTEPMPILPDDTPETLLVRQYPVERELYLRVITHILKQFV